MRLVQLSLPLRWEQQCPRCGYTFAMQTDEDKIVEVLRRASGPVYGTALGDLVGWSKSEIYRKLGRMVEEGQILKVGPRGGYTVPRRSSRWMRQELAA